MNDCTTLDDYLSRYGPLLGRQAEASLDPLHVPGKTPLPDFSQFLRQPYTAQEHAVAGKVAALKNQDSIFFCGECGVGKTIASMMAVHLHAGGKPYRVIVMCPGHLVEKWQREIRETIPNTHIQAIKSTWDMLGWKRGDKPKGAEWYIVSRETAKLGSKWEPAATKIGCHAALPVAGGLRCPRCGGRIEKKNGTGATVADLAKSQKRCERTYYVNNKPKTCGEPLWQWVGRQKKQINKWPVAHYIHKHLKHYFDYFILDEAHEEKGEGSAQGMAAGSMGAAAKKCILLTGTLIGGYANHIRPLLFRFSPQSLVDEGMTWQASTAFDRKYGRIEKVITDRSGGDSTSHRMSRGKSERSVRESVKPGIMPTLFGRHLLGNSLYLSLNEVSDQLPELREIIVPVDMAGELALEYERVEKKLADTNKNLLLRGNKALLGAMLQCLLAYEDLPNGWDMVGYWHRPNPDAEPTFIPVVQPRDLGPAIQPKEQKLLDIVKAEREAGRQVWVFVQYTDKRDVVSRLVELLEKEGYVTKELRSTVPLAKREKWIKDNAPGTDVIVSHPKLVETGLDLFDKGGGHNFVTLVFYETGYNLFTLRQAGRRAWRIGQKRECRVYYLFYNDTMQARAMALMGKKLHAAQALEGKFSSDGLVAMGGDDMSVEMALAQSLDSSLGVDTARCWDTIAEVSDGAVKSAGKSGVPVGTPEKPPDFDEDAAALADLLAMNDDDCPVFEQDDDDLMAFLDTMAELEGAA